MENNSDKIKKTALKLMSSKGYHGTSIQTIADQVGITKSTIFHYFKNKEGIFLAILEEHVPAKGKGLKEIADDTSLNGVEKLKTFIFYHTRLMAEKGAILDLNIRETKYFGRKNKAIYSKMLKEYANNVEAIVRQIQREDKMLYRDLDTKVVANGILGMINYAVLWYKSTGMLSIDEIANHFFKIVTGGAY